MCDDTATTAVLPAHLVHAACELCLDRIEELRIEKTAEFLKGKTKLKWVGFLKWERVPYIDFQDYCKGRDSLDLYCTKMDTVNYHEYTKECVEKLSRLALAAGMGNMHVTPSDFNMIRNFYAH